MTRTGKHHYHYLLKVDAEKTNDLKVALNSIAFSKPCSLVVNNTHRNVSIL